jgi:hypothetical protein
MAEQETFPVAVETINGLSDKESDDAKALVVRLELMYYEYGDLERLVAAGVEALDQHLKVLNKAYTEAKVEGKPTPTPFTPDDLHAAATAQSERVRKARELQHKITRVIPKH